MINLLDLQPNKVTTNLNGYPFVFMAESGDGKTYTLNKVLKEIADEDKVPLFLMFEDRYQHIPNIMALRVKSVPELMSLMSQLRNPALKNKFSSIVIDTADKLDGMIEKYQATSKEVEITGDLNFGKGNKYIKSTLYFITELRNMGWTVHFAVQANKNTNIITQKTSYECKVNKELWGLISHDAYLVGFLSKEEGVDPKVAKRYLTFKKCEQFPQLKDSIGMPEVVEAGKFKETLAQAILSIDGAEFTEEDTINHVLEEIDFEKVKARGMELGQLLAQNNRLDEAMNILKTHLGMAEDGKTVKMFDSLLPAQAELAQVVVIKLEELAKKYSLI